MSHWTSFCVRDLINKKNMTIVTKWNNESIQILILREGLEPLKGQVNMVDLTESAKNFNKSPEEYFDEIKQELGGKDDRVEFFVKGSAFHWKRRAWKRGSIECHTVTNVIDLSHVMIDIMMAHVDAEENTLRLKSENNNLKQTTLNLEKMLNAMTGLKDAMETELYKKFIILLNSKKMNACKLKQKLKSPNSIYHQSTDGSESEHESTLQSGNSQKSKCLHIQSIENIGPEGDITCSSIFSNISSAVVNDQQIPETATTLDCDSDESFVLKLSPLPAQKIEPQSPEINVIHENIEDD